LDKTEGGGGDLWRCHLGEEKKINRLTMLLRKLMKRKIKMGKENKRKKKKGTIRII
jgi:hypothetical protein